MMKLARNAWATYNVFHGPDGPIDYSYVEKLIRKQEEEGVKYGGNKVTCLTLPVVLNLVDFDRNSLSIASGNKVMMSL